MGRKWTARAEHTSPALVEEWWDERPESNVGIAAGSGLVVLDFDLPNGLKAWADLQAEFGTAPPTWTVRTGSGGRHLYYLLPTGVTTGNSLPGLQGVENIDVRGFHGQVVAEPSLHYSGNRYETVLDVEPAVLPEWLLVPRTRGRATRKRSAMTAKRPAREVTDTPRVDAYVSEWWSSVDDEAALPEKVEHWIRTGRPGENQSGVVFEICLVAVQRHYNPALLLTRLLDETNKGGVGVQRRENEQGSDFIIDTWFRRTFENAIRQIAPVILRVRDARQGMDAFEWRDMEVPDRNGEVHKVRGRHVREVMEAVLDLAESYTSDIDFPVSKKKIAEMTGRDRKTVRRALFALETLGFIEVIVPATTTTGWYSLAQPGKQDKRGSGTN